MKNTILYSGTIGTMPWTLDEKGTLIIGASIEITDVDLEIPWWEYSVSHKILRIIGKSPFVAIGSCHRWFGDLTSVKSLDLSGWDISTWNTSRVRDMWKVFEGCWNLESLDLSIWDTSSVKNMEGMFIGCKNLKFLDISTQDLTSINKRMMFAFCENLEIVMVLESYKKLKDSFKQKNSNSFLQLEFGLNQDDQEYIQTNENPFSSQKDSSYINTFLVRKDRLIYTIDISSQKYVLKPKERKAISYSLEPVNPLFPSLSWKSKDSNIVSVNQEGILDGHQQGKTTIIVSSINEVSAKLDVEVLEEEKTNSSLSSKPSLTFLDNLTALIEVIQNIKEIGLLYEKGILDKEEFFQLKSNLLSLLKE